MPLVNAVTVANLSSSSSITPTSPMPIDLDQSSSTSFSIPGSFPGRDTPSVPSEPSSSTRSSLQLTRPTCARPDCSYARYTPLPTLFSANPKTDYTLRKVVELLCQALLDVRADAVFHDGTSTPPLDHSFEPLFRDVPLPESEPPMPKRDDPSRTSSSSSSGGDGGEETLGNDDMKRAHKMKRDWTTSKKFKQSLRTNPEYGSDAIEDFTTPTAPRHPSTFPTRSISLDVSTVRTLLADLQSECECQVCFQLFYEPITCPCGHSFCQRCLARAYDHSQNCPLCRSDLPPQSYFLHQRPNATISALIATAFPDLDAERTASVREEELASLSNVPIFVCTTAWPGIKCFLHIFEPHYRLMIRRALDSSSREFGMVLPSGDGAGGVNAYGTMVRITSCTVMEDGRSIVQTVGTSRFRILERGMLDGYNIGRIERVDDVSPEQEQALEQAALARNEQDFDEWAEPDQPGGSSIGRGGAPTRPPMTGNVELSTQQLMQICVDFIWTLRAQSAPSVLERLNNTVGDMPQTPAEFTWWCGEVMPVEDHVKVALLQITSVRERLRLIVFWIEQFRSSWWYSRGCTIS
ncbi:SPOSA6832_01751 [Sporobolomyces salmonicolor]|uniref:SPOSA6832_01751-mRNA-1:cds n=1 Tax=Sporidiobolus salmonicolor TaxID=5005 RepID=A0A0D6EJM9_SPOSA|nr:SPOSA6832_01751 [Sporobolomyces salmonicolor]